MMNAEDRRLMIKAVADGFKIYYKIAIGLMVAIFALTFAIDMKVDSMPVTPEFCGDITLEECAQIKAQAYIYTLVIKIVALGAIGALIYMIKRKEPWDKPCRSDKQ